MKKFKKTMYLVGFYYDYCHDGEFEVVAVCDNETTAQKWVKHYEEKFSDNPNCTVGIRTFPLNQNYLDMYN